MQPNHTLKAKLWILSMFISLGTAFAQDLPKTLEWNINGQVRKALVYTPTAAKNKPTPVIFAFHGHGGTMLNMYRTRGFEKLWPEAIFVCPQGLNTVGMLTDPEGKKSGWVMDDQTNNNRDLQFFDAMLKTLRSDYNIDDSRIYATGHSNGGGFTYLLWATRAYEFAAFAPTATAAGKIISKLNTPKPGFHLIGEADPLVKPSWQKITYNKMLRVNGCNIAEGTKVDNNVTFYKGKDGNDFELFIHDGGHEYPKNANQPIIDFFKKYVKK
jgi:polyhydroxybutyrate depolymerase